MGTRFSPPRLTANGVAFRMPDYVGTPEYDFGAQWLAWVFPQRRLAVPLLGTWIPSICGAWLVAIADRPSSRWRAPSLQRLALSPNTVCAFASKKLRSPSFSLPLLSFG
jgi:hypothetical protein